MTAAEIIFSKELDKNLRICRKCGFHFRIDAPARIALLLAEPDPPEIFGAIRPADPLTFADTKRYVDRLRTNQQALGVRDAVMIVEGRLEGLPIVLAVLDMSAGLPTTTGAYDRTCGTDGDCNPVDRVPTPDAFFARLAPAGESALRVRRSFWFEAAHHLPHHPGKCRHPHGHSYRLVVVVEGEPDPASGMVIDFADLKRVVGERVVDLLDHRDVNALIDNPTAEVMAMWIWGKLAGVVPGLCEVELHEARNCSVIYRGE